LTGKERELRGDSDELLEAADELKRLEQQKRGEQYSSSGFHDLGERVERQARHVFNVAAEEREDADAIPSQPSSIDETAPPSAGLADE
jgi:hypothetical protein